MAKGTTVYVSAKFIPGGPYLDDDLGGWHVCRLHTITTPTLSCYWDGRNNKLIIAFPNGPTSYNITEDSATEQQTSYDGKWYVLELEAENGKTKINNPDN